MIPITEEAYIAKDNLFRLNLAMRLIGDCTFMTHTNTLSRNELFRSIEDFIGRLPELEITSPPQTSVEPR